MRNTLPALFILLCALLGNGCVVSRVGENALAVGVVEYYADYSTIQDGVVYESEGAFYINVEEVGYKLDPEWIGLIAPPSGILKTHRHEVKDSRRSVWLKISSEAKAYLCDGPEEAREYFPSFSLESEEVADIAAADAVRHPTVRGIPLLMTLSFSGGDIITHSRELRRERSVTGYCMIPVAVAGFAWDIPATVVMSVCFDFVVFPIVMIAKIF